MARIPLPSTMNDTGQRLHGSWDATTMTPYAVAEDQTHTNFLLVLMPLFIPFWSYHLWWSRCLSWTSSVIFFSLWTASWQLEFAIIQFLVIYLLLQIHGVRTYWSSDQENLLPRATPHSSNAILYFHKSSYQNSQRFVRWILQYPGRYIVNVCKWTQLFFSRLQQWKQWISL